MAVIKGNYVRRDGRTRSRARATIRYIQSRPNERGQRRTRELFGSDGTLTREQAFRMIDAAGKETIFYRLVLSPDPATEDSLRDIDLTDLTISVMLGLEERLKIKILFAAAEHSDHSPHRHVHILALLNRKLGKKDLQFLRDAARQAILQQRRIRELARAQEAAQSAQFRRIRRPATADRTIGEDDALAPAKPVHACPSCNESGGLAMHRLTSSLYRCSSCGLIIRQTAMEMQIERTGADLTLGAEYL